MHELLEREDKWDVSDRFVLPHLQDLIDDGDIDATTVRLESTYYDTADHDLQSHGIVLRRRDGDDDTGWQLKVPEAEGRIEIRTALTDAPPPELEELLTGLRLGKQLVNVATIRTERTRYRIREPDGTGCAAEVADDQVHASVGPRTFRLARDRGRVRAGRADRCLAGWPKSSARLVPVRRGIPRSWHTRLALSVGETPTAPRRGRSQHYVDQAGGRDLRRRHAAAARAGPHPRHPGRNPQVAQHDSCVRQAARPVDGRTRRRGTQVVRRPSR